MFCSSCAVMLIESFDGEVCELKGGQSDSATRDGAQGKQMNGQQTWQGCVRGQRRTVTDTARSTQATKVDCFLNVEQWKRCHSCICFAATVHETSWLVKLGSATL